MATQKYTQKQVVAALMETKGLVYLAAKKLGCEPATIHNYAKRYAAVKEALVTARGEVVDVAEAALYKGLLAGEQWAVLFALRTLGKDRGYVERVQQEVTGADRGPVEIGVKPIDYRAGLAALAPRPVPDRHAPGPDENPGDGTAVGQVGAGRGTDA